MHTVRHFNPQLFSIYVKSKVLDQCCSEVMPPTVDSSVAWFPVVWKRKVIIIKQDWFLHEGPLLDLLIFLLYLLQSVCCSKYFFYLKSISSFSTPISYILKHFKIYLSCKIFQSYCDLNFTAFWSFLRRELRIEKLYKFCHMAFCLHGLVWWRLTVSK